MKNIDIQCLDGTIHSIFAHKFYSVVKDGCIFYVLEYDDSTINARNCFTILIEENGVFVNRPLSDKVFSMMFGKAIRYHKKKVYNVELLPEQISLCSDELSKLGIDPITDENKIKEEDTLIGEETKEVVQTEPEPVKKERIIVYREITSNHFSFPYYLDEVTAILLGFVYDGTYYHLSPVDLVFLQNKYEIIYRDITSDKLGGLEEDTNKSEEEVIPVVTIDNIVEQLKSKKDELDVENKQKNSKKSVVIYTDISDEGEEFPYYLNIRTAMILGLASGKSVSGYYHLTPQEVEHINSKRNLLFEDIVLEHTKKRVIVYEDTSPKKDSFPYYLDYFIAKPLGFDVIPSQYYHLTDDELKDLKAKYDVVIEPKLLVITSNFVSSNNIKAFIDKKTKTKTQKKLKNGNLSDEEIKEINDLYDGIVSFVDFYQFFGFEDMKEAPVQEILKSERMTYLENLLIRGKKENIEIAAYTLNFLDKFKSFLYKRDN